MTVLILFCIKKEPLQALLNGGRGGIRTHGTLAGSTVFKTGPINHSGTLPSGSSAKSSSDFASPILLLYIKLKIINCKVIF